MTKKDSEKDTSTKEVVTTGSTISAIAEAIRDVGNKVDSRLASIERLLQSIVRSSRR